MTQQVVLVDKNDRELGTKPRDEVTKDDIYRIAALWLTNPKGQVLIAQRSMTKDVNPGKWGPAVVGTVEPGETYETDIAKESEEELGLTDIKMTVGHKFFFPGSNRNKFCQFFYANTDKNIEDFVIQEEEVSAIRWIDAAELIKDVQENPEKYTPSLFRETENIIKAGGQYGRS